MEEIDKQKQIADYWRYKYEEAQTSELKSLTSTNNENNLEIIGTNNGSPFSPPTVPGTPTFSLELNGNSDYYQFDLTSNVLLESLNGSDRDPVTKYLNNPTENVDSSPPVPISSWFRDESGSDISSSPPQMSFVSAMEHVDALVLSFQVI
jgi:hypothetical protein